MNKKIALVAGLCLLLMAVAVSAQDKKMNFAGDWTLDKEKSELGERSRIESMTMKVTQTEKELTIERKAKRAEPSGGNEGRRRGMRRGGGNQGPVSYSLDGKETKKKMEGGRFSGEIKFKAESEKDGKMKLMQTRSFETPMGSRSMKTTETWELSADGKTLTVSSETETPRGTRSSKMVFTKGK